MNNEALWQTINHALIQEKTERRLYPRHAFNARIQYRTEQMTYFEEGMIQNLSQGGMLLLPLRQLELKATIHVVIPPDQPGQQSIRITAVVINQIHSAGDDNVCYNCRIEHIVDPNVDDQL